MTDEQINEIVQMNIAIRHCYEDAIKRTDWDTEIRQERRNIAKWLEELKRQKESPELKNSKWISVVKEYPPRYKKVLGYVQKLGMMPYITTVSFMDLSDKFFVDSYGNEVTSISHWMPLPKPPEAQ